MDFRGWIPTVTGRLSFSIVGDSVFPTKSITSNVSGQSSRYVITYQKRNALDVLVPPIVARNLLGLSGDLWFVCIAKCSNDASKSDDILEGILFLHTRGLWRGNAEKLVKAAQRSLDEYSLADHGRLSNHFDEDFTSLMNRLKPLSVFYSNFSLTRSGIVKINVPEDVQEHVNSKAPTFPTNPSLRKERFHTVCSQQFFFLKDISHVHQHHVPSTDTMIDLYYFEGDDFRWRCEILRFLQRRILQFKRTPSQGTINAAFGLLSYAQSFIRVCKEEKHTIEPQWFYDNLMGSLKSAQEKVSTEIQDKIRKSDVFRNVVISTLGIFLSYISLVRIADIKIISETEKVSPFLAKSAKILVVHPGLSFSIFFLIVISIMFYTKIIDIRKVNLARNLVRLLHSLKSRNLSFVLMVLSLSLAWLAGYLFKLGM